MKHPLKGYQSLLKAQSYKLVNSLSELSQREFIDNYYTKQKPVLISQAATNWPAVKKWSEDYFAKKIGNKIITLNSFKYLPKKIIRTILPSMTMVEAIKIMQTNQNLDERFYLLRDSLPNNYPELLEDIYDVPWLDPHTFCSRDLWFGDGLNITPIHFDTADNFIVSVFGSKTVYLYPPENTYFLYPHNFLTEGRFNFAQTVSKSYASPQLYPSFFEQGHYQIEIYPGDILYIPIGWWHEVHTHLNRAASITYFFNNRKNRCLLWHFLNYQSCRLHEISTKKDVQNILYTTNYSNALDSVNKLFQKKQSWMAVVLIGALLEHILNLATKKYYVDLHKILKKHSHNIFVKKLIQNPQWLEWERIINIAKNEKNEALDGVDVRKFIQEMSCFIKNISENLKSSSNFEKHNPLIEVRNLSQLSSY